MSGVVDTITSIFKTESNNAANVKANMNKFASNANNTKYGKNAAAAPKNSGFLNTITGLFETENDPALNVRAKAMSMNKNANNTKYGKNANNGWFSTIKKAFTPQSRPLNPNAPEYIPQSTAAMIAAPRPLNAAAPEYVPPSTQGGRRRSTRRRSTRRRASTRRN